MDVQRTCQECGKTFYVNHCEVVRNKGKFCSRACVYEYMSTYMQQKRREERQRKQKSS